MNVAVNKSGTNNLSIYINNSFNAIQIKIFFKTYFGNQSISDYNRITRKYSFINITTDNLINVLKNNIISFNLLFLQHH